VTGARRSPEPGPAPSRRKCPICGKAATEEAYPFCSKRCAKVDLNRWLSGTYVIPAAEETPDDRSDAEE
jgi:uncharacterized protein